VLRKKSRRLEVSLGLTARMGPHELAHHLGRAGDSEVDMVNRLVHDLAWYSSPSIKVPRIRRFTVELVIGMLGMDSSSAFAELMAAAGMGGELRRVAETMSELECFHVFSVSAGVSRHAVSLCALVGKALEHMGMDAGRRRPVTELRPRVFAVAYI
jgi:hypothetical protein